MGTDPCMKDAFSSDYLLLVLYSIKLCKEFFLVYHRSAPHPLHNNKMLRVKYKADGFVYLS